MFVPGHDDRSLTNDYKFKENVYNRKDHIQPAQSQNLPVYFLQAPAPDELIKAQACETDSGKDGKDAKIIGDFISQHANAGGLMDRPVDPGEADAGLFRSDRLNVNGLYQQDEDQKQQNTKSRSDNFLFHF